MNTLLYISIGVLAVLLPIYTFRYQILGTLAMRRFLREASPELKEYYLEREGELRNCTPIGIRSRFEEFYTNQLCHDIFMEPSNSKVESLHAVLLPNENFHPKYAIWYLIRFAKSLPKTKRTAQFISSFLNEVESDKINCTYNYDNYSALAKTHKSLMGWLESGPSKLPSADDPDKLHVNTMIIFDKLSEVTYTVKYTEFDELRKVLELA